MQHQATLRGIGVGMGGEGGGAPAVLLEAGGRIVPIFIGPDQAQSIERARRGIQPGRPMTHDLLVDVMDELEGDLERVRIDELRDETFIATLELATERGGTRLELERDARPSDGIALAVRVSCPVTVDESVIEEAGLPPERLGLGPEGGPGEMGLEAFGDTGPLGARETDVTPGAELDPERAVDIDIEGPEEQADDREE